jgi:hypothetical protein
MLHFSAITRSVEKARLAKWKRPAAALAPVRREELEELARRRGTPGQAWRIVRNPHC